MFQELQFTENEEEAHTIIMYDSDDIWQSLQPNVAGAANVGATEPGAKIWINDDFNESPNQFSDSYGYKSLVYTIKHEIGHVLGFLHTNEADGAYYGGKAEDEFSLMNGGNACDLSGFSIYDIIGIQNKLQLSSEIVEVPNGEFSDSGDLDMWSISYTGRRTDAETNGIISNGYYYSGSISGSDYTTAISDQFLMSAGTYRLALPYTRLPKVEILNSITNQLILNYTRSISDLLNNQYLVNFIIPSNGYYKIKLTANAWQDTPEEADGYSLDYVRIFRLD